MRERGFGMRKEGKINMKKKEACRIQKGRKREGDKKKSSDNDNNKREEEGTEKSKQRGKRK